MHNLFLSLSLPLLLKLAAVSVTGTLTLVTCRNMHRKETLQTQMVDIRNSLRNLPTPPTIYVVGFKGRGKSGFINTACRVLAEEDGQFVFRTETAPLGPTRTTQHSSTIHAVDPDGRFVATLVDTPGLPIRCLTRSDVEAAVRHTHLSRTPSPDCIVMVLRCTDALRLSELRLAEIVSVVRERGLHLVVLLTHKKALKSKVKMEALRREVATRVRTDCIYFIDNYTVESSAVHAVHNNFDTHNVTLAIIRQCIEFTITRRSNLSSTTHSAAITEV